MQLQEKETSLAERIIMGFIVFAASLCVGLITLYLCMFDGRGLMH